MQAPDLNDAQACHVTKLCREIESRWPGVIAGYSGFAKPRPLPEDTDAVIEAFMVPLGMHTEIIRGTYAARKALNRDYDCHVAVVCHSIADSLLKFADDVRLLTINRSPQELSSS